MLPLVRNKEQKTDRQGWQGGRPEGTVGWNRTIGQEHVEWNMEQDRNREADWTPLEQGGDGWNGRIHSNYDNYGFHLYETQLHYFNV